MNLFRSYRKNLIVLILAGLLMPVLALAQPVTSMVLPGGGPDPVTGVPAGSVILYDQTTTPGSSGITSQNFEAAFDTNDSTGADDFVVTDPAGWAVTQVNIGGSYNQPQPPVTNANLYFYADNAGAPGAVVCSYPAISAVDDTTGNLEIALPTVCNLPGGGLTYWVSVQVNKDATDSIDQWWWNESTPQVLSESHWENPGNGFGTGCTTFSPRVTTCGVGSDLDLMFAIIGEAADFGITLDDDPDPVVAGLTTNGLTHTLEITNHGPSDPSGTPVASGTIDLTIPAGVSYVGSLGSQPCAAPSDPGIDQVAADGAQFTPVPGPDQPAGTAGPAVVNLNWTASGTWVPGQCLAIVYTFNVGPSTVPGTDVITSAAAITSTLLPDDNAANDTATEGTTVQPTSATWRVLKEFSDGGSGTADITLTCTSGNVNATGTTTDTQTVSGGQFASFTVLGFLMDGFGSTNCVVTEDNPTDGYYGTLSGAACNVSPVVHQGTYLDCVVTNAPTRATFHVVKGFSDDNPMEVAVTLSCNTGLPLEQTKMIVDDNTSSGGVDFVVTDYTEGTLDCVVTEEDVLGYEPRYTNRSVGSENRDDGCFYEDVVGGADHSCFIKNDLQKVRIDVTKTWIDDYPEFQNSTYAHARWFCDDGGLGGATIDDGQGDYCNGYWDCGTLDFYGKTSQDHFFVNPSYKGTHCHVDERIRDSGVEADDSDCSDLVLYPGIGAECEIVNTRFYEGIPTLSHYGLAVLALLMLGVGMVGFRRFV